MFKRWKILEKPNVTNFIIATIKVFQQKKLQKLNFSKVCKLITFS